MTDDYRDIVARIFARKEGRAIAIRSTSALSRADGAVFGIAPIRVVAEQRAQAIAFGVMGRPPQIVITWHPLGRDSGWLEPFAEALDDYLKECLINGRLPRVWVPHRMAFEVIDLIGHRYRRNAKASDSLRRMGAQLRALAVEYGFAGQQVMVVAGEQLRAHAVGGQQPMEDGHLGAFLVWFNPKSGVDPTLKAARRSLKPAAAMLERKYDDRIEHLRKIAKSKKAAAAMAREEIERILRRGAKREWKLLELARCAFNRIGLPPAPEMDVLIRASFRRMQFALERDLSIPSQPHSLSRRLDTHEHAVEMLEDVEIRSDEFLREQARHRGRVFFAEVIDIDQPRRGRKPCTLTLHTFQEVLRIRPDSTFQTIDGRVIGRVLEVREGGGAGRNFHPAQVEEGREEAVPS